MEMELKDKSWTVIETEYLFRRPWLTARRDKLLLPNGKIHPEYYVLEFPEWVNVIALTREDRMVMVRQYRHGLGEYQTELVAGYVDPDDGSLLAAAQRELREETGFGGGRWEAFEILSANPANHSNLTHTFIARDVEYVGAQSLDDTEDVRCMLMSREEVMGLLRRGEIRQALMAAVLWRFFYENRLS